MIHPPAVTSSVACDGVWMGRGDWDRDGRADLVTVGDDGIVSHTTEIR